jgi:hypothetical protein
MSNYRTPGVYIEEIPKFPPSVAAVETAIPAFIGFTQKARRDGEDRTLRPTRITSLLEFEEYFGFPQPEENIVVTAERTLDGGKIVKELWTAAIVGDASRHIMYYALQSFFDNGGGPCYIVAVHPADDQPANYLPTFGGAIPRNRLEAGLNALRTEDEPTLIIFPEGQGMDPNEYFGLLNVALQQCEDMKDRFVIMDLPIPERDLTNTRREQAVAAFRGGVTNFLKYGAAYFPNIRTVFNYVYDSSKVKIIIVENGTALPEATLTDLNNAERSKALLAIDSLSISLPPSAAVAGVYARVDNARGVWKAPANESINSLDGLSFKVTDDIQNGLNVDDTDGKSINCIRYFIGKGYKIWGSRTLAGNDNEWRYVPVRRFFNMVEESVKKATAQFVFEPNDANTWLRVKTMIENFLILQWRAGALQGIKIEHAFYVKVGLNETMTALDILEGRMIVEIGMAVVRPAEFIILRFSHKMAES